MDANTLYDKVMKAINWGSNVEIRKGSDGELKVYELKRKSI